MFHTDLVSKLLNKDYFTEFFADQFTEMAESYKAEVDLDEIRSCCLAHDRYLRLHDMFKKAIFDISSSSKR
jgi:hypothetical protein